jgi:TetR/AcrR family transcriptional regulator, transcriptional repressor for nem operon
MRLMPREKLFNDAAVLERAADLFAAHGYQGTSLAMLLSATGLGKQSLYNSFGDKRALYLKSVECAAARYASVQARMRAAPTGRAAVVAFFDQLVGQCASSDPETKSCIVSAGLLEGVDDEGIAHVLRDKWLGTHEVLRAAVERGQKDGSIASAEPSAALADLLLSVVGGLRVSARAKLDPARLRRTVELALAVLDQADPHTRPDTS